MSLADDLASLRRRIGKHKCYTVTIARSDKEILDELQRRFGISRSQLTGYAIHRLKEAIDKEVPLGNYGQTRTAMWTQATRQRGEN